uniref:Polyketide synthase n=1 Tax=Sorangium cellulosum TaxID=56 RepID=A4F5D7_SORCE|nr:polyketide synthase [Sorangium cellulosum]
MSTTEEKLRAYLKQAMGELRQTHERLRVVEESKSEPIAIVAMGCRFPGGVRSPEDLWALLVDGKDAISPFPESRGWNLDVLAGGGAAREGGFVEDADLFDPAFFSISPREARDMDPQQRVLLEIAWETIERAGIDPASLSGTNAGVFVGVMQGDYGSSAPRATRGHDGYAVTGRVASVASGRIAYTLGLGGPAISVDTACSSSLVTLHLAARALREDECSLALAGGVTIMATPDVFVELGTQHAGAPDGRCKSFAAGADGAGWAEGAGMLLLERLSDARKNGHPVLAVLRGSAINQDGKSQGLTAPNGPAQERVIRAALASARLAASDVDAVEAHGTGTTLGDPIEAQALLATYGQARSKEHPLWLGSLKSNVGHTQAAAGIGGVIKMVLALRHGLLPKTLHAASPSPHVDWSPGTVRLLTDSVPWEPNGSPRRAGVSSFGISGTNAHVILEEAPADEAPPAPDARPHAGALPFLLSAKTEAALRAQATRLHAHVARDPDVALVDVAASLATTRSHFERRAAVVADDRAALLSALAALAEGRAGAGTVAGEALPPGKVAFVFPGQGSQWPSMARALLASSPAFRAEIEACERALAPHVDWSLLAVLGGDEAHAAPMLERVDVVQPVLFAVMIALAATWRAAGVTPDAVVGHSQGEIAAAYVAGALSLEDAARVVALRSRAITKLAGRGAMAAVELTTADLEARLAPFGGRLAIAAINSPHAALVSGDPDAIDELVAELSGAQLFARKVRVDYASHSAHVEAIERTLLEALDGIAPRPATVPLYSAVTGERLDGEALGAAHWYRNLRHTVRFEHATRALLDDGHRFFVEVSPHPVLTVALRDTIDASGHDAVACASLRRDEGDLARFNLSLAELHTRGLAVDWRAFFAPFAPRTVALPTYAFQRERFWLDAPEARPGDATRSAASAADDALWQAIDRCDVDVLAETLGVQGDEARAAITAVAPALSTWRQRRHAQSTADAWRYRVVWKSTSAPRDASVEGTWLALTPAAGGELARAVTAALAARGAAVVTVDVAHDDADRGRLATRLRAAIADGVTVRGVLSFAALDETPLPTHAAVPTGLALTLALAQALGDAGITAPLWLFTRGAVSIGSADRLTRPAQAMTWGLGRVVGLEHPERWGGLVDVGEALGAGSALGARGLAHLVAWIAQRGDEDHVALRPAGLFARRLVRAPLGEAPAIRKLAPRGAILVTGGTGAIGAHVARWLAEHGAEHVVLTSRRGAAAPGAEALRDELTARGARVTIAACDVADREAIAALVRDVEAEGPVTAVFHAGGVGPQAAIAATDIADLADAVAGKAAGARHLDELFGDRALDAFVLFSSGAGVWGGGQQGAYAAANAFLDALAEERRARGLAATSVAWGAWAGGGMLAENAEADARLRRMGFSPMAPPLAVAALARALEHDETSVAVADIDWARFAPSFASARPRPLIGEIAEARRALDALAEPAAAPHGEPPLLAALRALDEVDRLPHLVALVLAETAAVLGHADASRIEPHRGFFDLGLDSLMSVELRRRLRRATGVALPATVTFDHPSPRRVAMFLRDTLAHALGEVRPERDAGAPERARAPLDEPIAIVGIGLRLPGGVADTDGLFRFLEEERDAVGPIPAARWDADAAYDPDPNAPGKSYVRRAALLDRVDLFDAAFFGISPREAKHIDPQHRILLETAWQALEAAGIVPGSLRDTQTGVFVGAGASDYAALRGALEEAEAYDFMGTISSFAAGRLAFTLGLQGPALSVDTACSSSLVALHLSCQSLRRGECDLALAAGVQVMAHAEPFVLLSRTRALAPDGRSKTFSANADGYGRGEGAVVLALERLSDARARRHPVLAVVRGSAVNHDGASSGITTPNGTAQQKVIRAALSDARLTPADVDVVECHGTGTSLGDPIEVNALAAVYAEGRPAESPLLVGALKTTLGHLEFAAGLAGVAKMVAALTHGVVPATPHTSPPNPHIDWDAIPIQVADKARPWPPRGRPRRAGVTAIGLSGTNAHVILEEAPSPAEPEVDAQGNAGAGDSALLFLLSAKTDDALRAQADRLRAHLAAAPDLALADVALSLATTRSHFECRAAIVAKDRDALLTALDALARGAPAPDARTGDAACSGKVAFVFPGQGSQWPEMAASLLETDAVFREQIEACERALAPHVAWSLGAVLRGEAVGGETAAPLDRVDVVQPVLFAVMVALAASWRAMGVEPDAVVGHSQGEIAAAYVAGALSLEDAAKVVALRARAITKIAGRGAMAAVELSADELEARLAAFDGRVSIAAINSPRATLVAGDVDAIDALVGDLGAAQIFARKVRVDYASHSAHVEAIEADLATELAGITPRACVVPLYSAVTGAKLDGTALDAAYWYRNLRQTVRFEDATRALLADQHRFFVEVSPHPVLGLALGETSEAVGASAAVVGTLRRDEGDRARLLLALAELHARGREHAWEAFFEPLGARRVALPTYAFQRERFWLEPTVARAADVASAGLTPADHPLLRASVALADADGFLFTGRLALAEQPWLGGHEVFGARVLPGTAFLELAIAAAHRAGLERVEELTLEAPLALPPKGGVAVQIAIGAPDEAGRRSMTIHARPDAGPDERAPHDGAWTRHASGTLSPKAEQAAFDLRAWPPPLATPITTDGFYDRITDAGIAYGGEFRGLRAAYRGGDDVFAEVALPEEAEGDAHRFGLHPALLDAALQALVIEIPAGSARVAMPFAWSGVTLHAVGASAARVRLTRRDDETVAIAIADAAGAPVASIDGLAMRATSPEQVRAAVGVGRDAIAREALFRVDWTELPSPTGARGAGPWAILGGDDALARAFASAGIAVEAHRDVASMTGALARGAAPPSVVVAPYASSDAGGSAARSHEAAASALALLEAWLADERLAPCALVVLTTRAIATRPDEDVRDLAHAPLWGLVRAAQAERPDRAIFVVDTDGEGASHRALAAALDGAEPQLALRGGRRLAPRLARATTAAAPPPRALDPNGTVLVTGGTGALGALVARHLVEGHGITNLLLTSRTGPDAPGAEALRRDLEARGARVTIAACDVASRPALDALVGSIPREHPLTAIVHAAGATADGVIGALTRDELAVVFRAKVDGALHLHEITRERDLAAFVLFSSASGVIGGPGMANYAAANTFLDALAQRRRALGLPASSLAWGYWDQSTGMSARVGPALRARMGRGGLRALSAEDGLALFDVALSHPDASLVPARFAAIADGTDALSPLLRGLARPRAARRSGGAGAAQAALAPERIAGLSEAERERAVADVVRGEIAAVLGYRTPSELDVDRPLREIGLDSLMALELRRRLAAASQRTLPATLLFNHPTPAALVRVLLAEIAAHAKAPPPAAGDEIDRLEDALSAAHANAAIRDRLTARLQTLLSTWDRERDAAADGDLADRVRAASDDELLSMFDREFTTNAGTAS